MDLWNYFQNNTGKKLPSGNIIFQFMKNILALYATNQLEF